MCPHCTKHRWKYFLKVVKEEGRGDWGREGGEGGERGGEEKEGGRGGIGGEGKESGRRKEEKLSHETRKCCLGH